jgi:hypothetical protein
MGGHTSSLRELWSPAFVLSSCTRWTPKLGNLSIETDQVQRCNGIPLATRFACVDNAGLEVDLRLLEVESEWWKGRTREGREGWFPNEWVEVLERREPQKRTKRFEYLYCFPYLIAF